MIMMSFEQVCEMYDSRLYDKMTFGQFVDIIRDNGVRIV